MATTKPGKTSGDDSELTLASEFPGASAEAWMGLVSRILGDGGYDDRLVARSHDGIEIQPLYAREDWPSGDDPSGFPGAAPFTRGHRADGRILGGWDIRQLHNHPDPRRCNRGIRQDLENGVSSILLRLDDGAERSISTDGSSTESNARVDGLMLATTADLDAALKDIDLQEHPVALQAGTAFLPAAAMLAELWRRRGVSAVRARGAFNADPISAFAMLGRLPRSVDDTLKQLADLSRYTLDTFPQATSVGVDTSGFHDAGASEAQELACALAAGVTYLRAVADTGISVGDALGQIAFTFSVDSDLMLSVAKLRAARRLWGRVAEASGATASLPAMPLHAITSRRMMARRDPWVNMLRSTVAAFAAAIAGADSITVLPFTAPLGFSDDFARRIARNTQIVLQEESFLNRVIDPAGGAWAVESLTDQLAQASWRLFQDIERAGGIIATLKNGDLARDISRVAAERQRHVATGEYPLTGSSAFAHLQEEPVAVEPFDAEAMRSAFAEKVQEARAQQGTAAVAAVSAALQSAGDGSLTSSVIEAAAAGATPGMIGAALVSGREVDIVRLTGQRLAEPFERLRDLSDEAAARSGVRPIVYLAAIGAPSAYTAPLTFAQNFCAAAGIDVRIGPGGTELADTIGKFDGENIVTAVLCSDASCYNAHGRTVAAALQDAGAKAIYVVGRPDALRDCFEGAVVDDFLYQGCDALAALRRILEGMGVEIP